MLEDVQPAPSSVEALLADARIAMTKENHQRAVQLLETAFERDSTHVGVRIELANALYAANGIDVFAVRAAIERLNRTKAASASIDTNRGVCTDGADPARSPDRFQAVAFDTEPLRRLASQREQIQRVSRLVVAGGLQRRAAAFSERSPAVRAKGYVLAAVTRVALHVLDLKERVQETGATLYVDTGVLPDRAFVACGDTPEGVARVEETLCRGRRGIREAAAWMRMRNDLVGSEQTSLLIELLEAHADAVQVRLSCAASAHS